jgi:hypothetical protein
VSFWNLGLFGKDKNPEVQKSLLKMVHDKTVDGALHSATGEPKGVAVVAFLMTIGATFIVAVLESTIAGSL